jgi:hypothetical protein
MLGSAESGGAEVAAAECGGGPGEEGESEQLHAVKFQRALDMDLPFGSPVRPYKI